MPIARFFHFGFLVYFRIRFRLQRNSEEPKLGNIGLKSKILKFSIKSTFRRNFKNHCHSLPFIANEWAHSFPFISIQWGPIGSIEPIGLIGPIESIGPIGPIGPIHCHSLPMNGYINCHSLPFIPNELTIHCH